MDSQNTPDIPGLSVAANKNGTNHYQSISSNSYTGMLGLPGVASARVELAGMAGPEEFKVVGVSSSWSFSSLLMQ